MPILTAQERLGTRVVGRYRIDRLLANGGMSVLFAARDLRAHRTVALKLLRAEDCVEERRKARFLQEMRLTAKLRHPNVVDVLDLGEDENGSPYLVMELLHGRSLQAELDEHGKLGFEQALAILLPVMEALHAVHAAGVVHRDVKPDNIFLHVDPRGATVPKLLDFGIAKTADTTVATRTGAVLGTPDYMAPEQVLAGNVGPSADIWAIGAVLYRALHGQTLFHAETSAEVIAKLTRDPVPPLRIPELAMPVCAAIDRALAREADDRYPDMRAFAEALVLCAREAGLAVAHAPVAERITSTSPVELQRTLTAPSRNIEPRWRKRQLSWLAALASLVIVAAVAAQWMARDAVPVAPPQRTEKLPAPAAAAAAAPTKPAPVAAANDIAELAPPADDEAKTPRKLASGAPAPARQARTAASDERSRPKPHDPVPSPRTSFAKQSSPGDLPVAVEW